MNPSVVSSHTLVSNAQSNAYIRGLYDADGCIYIRASRQVCSVGTSKDDALIVANSSEFWLAQRITSNNIRVIIQINGKKDLLAALNIDGLTISTSSVVSKSECVVSTTSVLSALLACLKLNNQQCGKTNFTHLYNCLTSFCLPVPTIKQLRLELVKSFIALPRPLMVKKPILHNTTIDWLLVWLLMVIAHKNQQFERLTKNV